MILRVTLAIVLMAAIVVVVDEMLVLPGIIDALIAISAATAWTASLERRQRSE